MPPCLVGPDATGVWLDGALSWVGTRGRASVIEPLSKSFLDSNRDSGMNRQSLRDYSFVEL